VGKGKKNAVQPGILFKTDFVKVAAGISVFGKTDIIFLPKKFNGKIYADLVLPVFKEEIEKHGIKYLMQDNSSIHYEKKFVIDKLKEFDNILDWPPRSPDLNPIENLWAFLSYKLRFRKFENERQLKMAIREEYNQVPQSLIFNLCNSFHSRLKKCIDSKGQMIS
jgi:transposase